MNVSYGPKMFLTVKMFLQKELVANCSCRWLCTLRRLEKTSKNQDYTTSQMKTAVSTRVNNRQKHTGFVWNQEI